MSPGVLWKTIILRLQSSDSFICKSSLRFRCGFRLKWLSSQTISQRRQYLKFTSSFSRNRKIFSASGESNKIDFWDSFTLRVSKESTNRNLAITSWFESRSWLGLGVTCYFTGLAEFDFISWSFLGLRGSKMSIPEFSAEVWGKISSRNTFTLAWANYRSYGNINSNF